VVKFCYEKVYVYTMLMCGADVLALASALCKLGTCLRVVRTALWCALQLTCADLPPTCVNRARETAARHIILTVHHGAHRKPHTISGTTELLYDHGDDVFSDGDEIPEEDETQNEDMPRHF